MNVQMELVLQSQTALISQDLSIVLLVSLVTVDVATHHKVDALILMNVILQIEFVIQLSLVKTSMVLSLVEIVQKVI